MNGKLEVIDHPKEVWVRYTYSVKEQPRRVSFYKKRNQMSLDVAPPPLYCQYPIPIKEKAEDLQKLVSEYVPPQYQPFYAEIPVTENDQSSDEEMDF